MGNIAPDSRGSVLAPLLLQTIFKDHDPESPFMQALLAGQPGAQQEEVDQQAVKQQVTEQQVTEQQGINQLNNIPPQIAQMLGAPQVNSQQQAQQQQIQAQEESRQREAQNKASFEKDEEFENVMKALGSVNGLMQNR